MSKYPLLILIGLLSFGCQSMYNQTLEKVFGYEKRELLASAVESVQKDEKKAQVEFKDALTQLKELYAYNGGDLEGMYNKVQDAYNDAKSQSDTVQKRIDNMENIAHSMFSEWKKEIGQYSNPTFAQNSKVQLKQTQQNYAQLSKAVKSSKSAMQPVLNQLHDHVLYLKHNLNSAALGSLQDEAIDIQAEIEKLIVKMNQSIMEADKFIEAMPKT